MTIMTTTFIPCSAKLPIIALIAGALFGGAWWVAPSAYFIGVFAIIVSGIMLKKTKMFSGDPAPFVMELPAYHWPTVGNVLRSMWERGWSFIKKAGTVILLATIFVWFTSSFGWENGSFGMVDMESSILAVIGNAIAWIFTPLGWGTWQAAVASITGLIAKENVVGTFGVLFGGFEEVAENGWQVWQNVRAAFTPPCGILLPDLQLAVRPLLRRNWRNQAGDEQCKMDLVCNRLPVRICVCICIGCLSAWDAVYRKRQHHWRNGSLYTGCVFPVYVVPALSREQCFKCKG